MCDLGSPTVAVAVAAAQHEICIVANHPPYFTLGYTGQCMGLLLLLKCVLLQVSCTVGADWLLLNERLHRAVESVVE
jgi:hypothetical protein